MFSHILSKFTKKPSSLKQEVINLKKQIERTNNYMDTLASGFWENGGSCCPFCGIPEYSLLEEKQDRRYERIKYLKSKLEKDSRIKQND